MVTAAPNQDKTYIYMCGKCQAGKSSLIKKLTGDQSVIVGNGEISCTEFVKEYNCGGEYDDIVCVDSPGLFDTGGDDKEESIMSEISHRMTNKPVSLFCFVMKYGPLSEDQKVVIRRIRYMF